MVSSSPLEVLLDQSLVLRDRRFDDCVASRFGRFMELSGNVDDAGTIFPSVSSSKMYCLRSMTSMWPVKVSPFPTGSWIGYASLVNRCADHLEAAIEVGAGTVHLVRENEARNAIPIALAPHRFGLRLNASHRVEQRDGAVEHAERALHFDGEVDVPRVSMMLIRYSIPIARPETRWWRRR